MRKPPEPILKGLVHAGLAILAAVESHHSKSTPRKVLLGCMAGWHAHSTFYHFVIEPLYEGNPSNVTKGPLPSQRESAKIHSRPRRPENEYR